MFHTSFLRITTFSISTIAIEEHGWYRSRKYTWSEGKCTDTRIEDDNHDAMFLFVLHVWVTQTSWNAAHLSSSNHRAWHYILCSSSVSELLLAGSWTITVTATDSDDPNADSNGLLTYSITGNYLLTRLYVIIMIYTRSATNMCVLLLLFWKQI